MQNSSSFSSRSSSSRSSPFFRFWFVPNSAFIAESSFESSGIAFKIGLLKKEQNKVRTCSWDCFFQWKYSGEFSTLGILLPKLRLSSIWYQTSPQGLSFIAIKIGLSTCHLTPHLATLDSTTSWLSTTLNCRLFGLIFSWALSPAKLFGVTFLPGRFFGALFCPLLKKCAHPRSTEYVAHAHFSSLANCPEKSLKLV